MNTMSMPEMDLTKEEKDEAHRQGMLGVRLLEDAQVREVREALIGFLTICTDGLNTISSHFQGASRAKCYIDNKIRQLKRFDLEE